MPPYDPHIHHRRSIRLKDYDYSQPGAYFITGCVANQAQLFGKITGNTMHLSDLGKSIAATWEGLPNHYAHIDMDVFSLMPNHLHAVLWILPSESEGGPISSEHHGPSVFTITRRFKSLTTNMYWRTLRESGHSSAGVRLWQRNYHEHVVRDEDELGRIREYIVNNVLRWSLDRENPDRTGTSDFEDWMFGDE